MTYKVVHMNYFIGQLKIEPMMIEALLGSKNAERVLIYIFTRGEGYGREIANYYKTGLTPIQKQLDRLEAGG